MGEVKNDGRRDGLWGMSRMVAEEMNCGRCGAWWEKEWIVGERQVLFSCIFFFFFFWSRKYLSAYHYLGSVLGRVLHEDFEGRELGLIWIYHVTVS